MHRSNATGLIDRLEARGLLQRNPIPGDRRAHQVVLTAAGRKLAREILPNTIAPAKPSGTGFPIRAWRESSPICP